MKNRCTMSFNMRFLTIAAFALLCVALPWPSSGQLIKTDLAEKEKTSQVSSGNTTSVDDGTSSISRKNTTTQSAPVRKQRITNNVSLKDVPYQKDTVNQNSSRVKKAQEQKEADESAPIKKHQSPTASPSRWRKE